MKILIVSDIHSNYPALQAIWEKEKDSDVVLIPGDLVDWGFFPHECVTWAREHDAVIVAGNHDHEVLDAYDSGVRYPTDGTPCTFHQYTIGQLTEPDLKYLRSLPESRYFKLDGQSFFMKHYPHCHVNIESPLTDEICKFDTIAYADREWLLGTGQEPDHFDKRVLLFGHYHECQIRLLGCGYTWIDPGAVAYRLGPNAQAKSATYVTVEDGLPSAHSVSYPMDVFEPYLRDVPFAEDSIYKKLSRIFFTPQT